MTTQANTMSDLDVYKLVSHRDLARATNNFGQDNLRGRGNFGSVYRGHLNNGVTIAVKVLNLEIEEASKSFEAECKALSLICHRNLIKIINVCSSEDFKALVLQFMPNGGLNQWLYSGATRHITLLERLNIMVDVSSGLEYLYYHHPHIVLHCDLKPSNILLDEVLTAYVSDFGIVKMLLGNSITIASAFAPGTIGYMPPVDIAKT